MLTDQLMLLNMVLHYTRSRSKLDEITAADLMEKRFDPQDELIEGMLARGLYMLTGASKIGKSWLILQITHHVSMGIPLWGRKPQRSEVPYSALEDTACHSERVW